MDCSICQDKYHQRRALDGDTGLHSVETVRAMAAYDFDDHNIKWNRLGDYKSLLFSIRNVDETNHTQGEHRLYEPDGEVTAHPSRPLPAACPIPYRDHAPAHRPRPFASPQQASQKAGANSARVVARPPEAGCCSLKSNQNRHDSAPRCSLPYRREPHIRGSLMTRYFSSIFREIRR